MSAFLGFHDFETPSAFGRCSNYVAFGRSGILREAKGYLFHERRLVIEVLALRGLECIYLTFLRSWAIPELFTSL